MNLSGGPRLVRDNLIFYLDPANVNSYISGSTTWNDISLSKYNGNFSNTEVLFNQNPDCFYVLGTTITTASFITLNTSISLAAGSEYTLDFYVKLRSGARTSLQMLCGQVATNPFLAITYNANKTWLISWRAAGGVYTQFTTVSNYNIEDNWINLTFVVTSDLNCAFYINGSFKETKVLTSSAFVIKRLASAYSSGGNFYCLDGYYGPSKVYNRALTSDEIIQNFNSTRGRFYI
jgi:hypothetical protein